MTPGNAAGYELKSSPSLPADATSSEPAAFAALTAFLTVLLGDGPPRLILMICARLGACTSAAFAPGAGKPAAYRIPCAMSKLNPEPVMSSTRIGRIFTVHAAP